MPNLAILKPKTAVEKRTHTTVDTIAITPALIATWKKPPGQRPLTENRRVQSLAGAIKQDGGVIPGVLTLGVLDGEYWVIDGQHRLLAFSLSGAHDGYADVRYFHATNIADINREFVELNSKLVTMRPDDFLRGMEDSVPALQQIRKACPYIGYDFIRRNPKSAPVVSMSATLRNWRASAYDTPSPQQTLPIVQVAQTLTVEDTRNLIDFMELAHAAFGREWEYARFWTALNMALCMWLYRNLVLSQYSQTTPRLDKPTFGKCLLAVSADSRYQDWLLGRSFGDRDRSPAYARLKTIFARRLNAELGHPVRLPAPAWANG